MKNNNPKPAKAEVISTRWLAAAVVGTWWGTFEIIVGSFLHNLRVPMSGTILSFFAVVLLVAFHQMWQERGVILRAGLVAALMKSLSPSAVILGPMTGILMEALFLEFFVLIMGKNLAGYLFGGAFAVLSALLHKIGTLLVLYGFDFVTLLAKLYDYAIQKLNIHEHLRSPWYALLLLTTVYVLTGAVAAVLGWVTGRKAKSAGSNPEEQFIAENKTFFTEQDNRQYSVVLLFLHLILLVFLMWTVSSLNIVVAAIFIAVYLTGVLIRYRRPVRYLKKPFFWVQLFVITVLAAMFWNGLQSGNFLNREGLLVGLRMNLRAVLVMVSFSVVSVELRNPLVRALLYKRGFSNLYLSLGLAFSALPEITKSFANPREALRSPYRVILRILRQADAMLEAFKRSVEGRPAIYMVTGAVDSGKTSFLTELVKVLENKGWNVGGFLARGNIENGVKKEYWLHVLPEGEEHLLCRANGKKKMIATGRYTFFPETIRWGEKMLRPARASAFDVIVIDEIGPLELKGQGWAGMLDRLITLKGPVQIWTVRSAMVDRVKAAWGIIPEDVFIAGKESPESAAMKIEKVLARKAMNKNG